MNVEKILSQLDKVKRTGPGKYMACCPVLAHDDRSPSLSIRETDDGTILLKCFAGCGAVEIVEAIGLKMTDLFPPRLPDGKHAHKPKAPRISWAEMFDAIETDLLALSIAWADFARGEQLSPENAAFLSSRADHLAETIREVRSNGR